MASSIGVPERVEVVNRIMEFLVRNDAFGIGAEAGQCLQCRSRSVERGKPDVFLGDPESQCLECGAVVREAYD